MEDRIAVCDGRTQIPALEQAKNELLTWLHCSLQSFLTLCFNAWWDTVLPHCIFADKLFFR